MTRVKQKIATIVTAIMLSASGSQIAAEYTISTLETIEQFISNGDWALLYLYLREHPELLNQSDALSRELREFVEAVDETGRVSNYEPPAVIPDVTAVKAEIASY